MATLYLPKEKDKARSQTVWFGVVFSSKPNHKNCFFQKTMTFETGLWMKPNHTPTKSLDKTMPISKCATSVQYKRIRHKA